MSYFLHTFKCGHTTKCEHIRPDCSKTQRFSVVYAHGFCSDPYGRKPEEVKKWCIEHKMGFFRFELAGHGVDQERFEDVTMNTCKSQIFEIIEDLVDGPVLVMGSSMGGWLSLLAACHFKERVIGFIGMAAAPDFLKTYFENNFKPEHKAILDQYGKIEFKVDDYKYMITKKMIESAHDNLLLENEVIPFQGKVRLLQGMKDASLQWKTALTIAQKMESDDVEVHLIKNANHYLGHDEDIKALMRALDDFLVND